MMDIMELLREYLWLWVIIGMIFVTVVISIIFFLINKCLSKRGKLNHQHTVSVSVLAAYSRATICIVITKF